MFKFKLNLHIIGQNFVCFILIYVVSTLIINILIRNYFISLIISFIFSIYANKKYIEYKIIKNKREFLNQFGEFLSSLSTSLLAGRNVYDSFTAAHIEMIKLYGQEARISVELKSIIESYKNGESISRKMMDIGRKSNIEDIENFAQVFSIGSSYGGNIAQIITESKNIINEKIATEREIERLIIQKKYELMLMTLMPFIVVFALEGFSSSSYDNSPSIVITRLFVLVSVFIANRIGKKIIDIR